MLELAKYVSHAEFRSHEGTDPWRLAQARSIRRISFEHNMIVVTKGDNTLPSNLPADAVPAESVRVPEF